MNSHRDREIERIREIQRELRLRLEELDHRITNLSCEEEPEPAPLPMSEVAAETPPPLVASEEIPPIPFVEPAAPVLVESELPPPLPTLTDPTPVIPEPEAAFSKPEPAAQKESLEIHFGRVWLVRIGIVILLTGLVLLGNFAWRELVSKIGPVGKLAMIYLSGFGLGAIGWFVKRRRAELATYGKVLIGGGIATVYYATYASHFVEPLRVIGSPFVGGTLLLALAAGIVWLADRMRSQAIASAAVILGFYTAAINQAAGFSLFSNLVLSVMAITLLLRRQWISVSFISLAGCYAAFAFWRFQTVGGNWASSDGFFWSAMLFPTCYWVVFTLAGFLGRAGTFPNETRSVFLTINNGAFAALTMPVVAATYPRELWIFVLGFGVLLTGLAAVAARMQPGEKSFDGSYLAQGLTLVCVGFLFKFSGYQLALIFALQSATLMKLSRMRHGVIMQVFSAISALVSGTIAIYCLLWNQPHAAITATGAALILIGTAWLLKFQRGLLEPMKFSWRAAGYVALATLVGTLAILCTLNGFAIFHTLVLTALLATASIYLLRMPEVVYGAQAIAAFAFAFWMEREGYRAPLPFAVLLAAGLALLHWWQLQKRLAISATSRGLFGGMYALGVVAALLAFAYSKFDEPLLTPTISACALVVLAYALVTRSLPLALASQIPAIFTIYHISLAIDHSQPWQYPVVALAIFGAQSFLASSLVSRLPEKVRAGLPIYAIIIRTVCLLLGLAAVFAYVPDQWQFTIMSTSAFALFLTKRPEAIAYAAALACCAVGTYMLANISGKPVFYPNIAGLLLILAAQQIGKLRLRDATYFNKFVQGALIFFGILGLWILTGRGAASVQSGFFVTISWSLLAFVVLAAGFALKERVYRWLGLGILTVAIARIFIIDVWQLDTIYRILSFLVLGVVLLALGFLYNRFADLLRKWI
jgi:uncharacterized membrane protein